MGIEAEPGMPPGSEGGDGALTTALEQRVFRLELELAALQRRLSDEMEPGLASAPPAIPEPPPPKLAPVKEIPPAQSRAPVAQAYAKISARVAASDAGSAQSFEDRLGSQILNRVAIVSLLIGTAYGLKLAVDRGFIGPAERVLIGLAAGAGLVVWSERFRARGFAAFSYSLKAVGTGVLYLSLWASFQIFHLLSAPVALAMMILVTAWNAFMAWKQNSELLAVYALVGGFAAPLLVSTGSNHEIFLFTYVLAIDLGAMVLVRLKTWPRLLLGVFPATVLFFIGWYVDFFTAGSLVTTSCFIVFFGAVFASASIGKGSEDVPRGQRSGRLGMVLRDVLLPISNAAFIALAFYSVLRDSGHHALLPWLMVALAALYLALMRAPQRPTAAAIHLSLAVVLLTVAVPLKASGHWITVCWLVEGLALTWVALRLAAADEQRLASRTLRWLASASSLLGFLGVCVHLVAAAGEGPMPFWNKATGTALTGVLAFAGTAWLALRTDEQNDEKSAERDGPARVAMGATLLIAATAALMTLREVGSSWFVEFGANLHSPLRSADFVTALLALGVLAALAKCALTIEQHRPRDIFWPRLAGATTILFNLIAVLTGVREVSAIWNSSSRPWNADDALRQALAISAFVMLYGAALLAIGFWRRSASLRWQGLALLVFTICKTFLYDMRSLSQGYRVASLLGLGVLLMAVSFAYQKDWLDLRMVETSNASPGSANETSNPEREAAQ